MSRTFISIGCVLLVLSALGLLVSIVLLFAAAGMGPGRSLIHPGVLGPGAAEALAGAVAVGFGIASLWAGILGSQLVMKKAVLQCKNCGAVAEEES